MSRVHALLPLLLLALPAHAGYRELTREIEEYQPPAIYGDALQEVPPVTGAASTGDAAFAAQIAALREEQARWRGALELRAPAG
ncbi:MAG TPA: hypothetical protein VK997_12230, partial [Deferrisomatales bacterium]|nr:hypothetical protein [Deferrisomatales bacterium]